MFLLSAKKEEVEAIEKEAKDKHEKEWEGERREKGSCIKSLALVSDNIEILDLLYKIMYLEHFLIVHTWRYL